MAKSLAQEDKIRNRLNRDARDLFWRFINERQQVWHRRVVEGQAFPWSEDEILNEYRFTNVYRELDPGTQYAIQHILEKDALKSDKIFNIMMYRLIGRLETHDYLGFKTIESFNSQVFEQELKYRRDVEDKPVFTGAYMVSGYNQMGSSDKVENVAVIFDQLSSDEEFFERLRSVEGIEDAYDVIRSKPGFGNFLSYQVLVDLLYPVDCYNGGSVLPYSHDEWSSPGPGAQKGLKKLVDGFKGFSRLDVMRWLRENQSEEFDRLGIDFPYLKTHDGRRLELSLANIQNCLCEFYKYHKILNSNGRARRCFRNAEARSSKQLQGIYREAPQLSLE